MRINYTQVKIFDSHVHGLCVHVRMYLRFQRKPLIQTCNVSIVDNFKL